MESSTPTAPSLQRFGASNPPYNIEITRGEILWLKPKSDCCIKRPIASIDMEDGCFDHPALILHSDPQQATATILLITSLNNTPLVDKFPNNQYFRHHHVPIYPAPAHPHTEWRYEIPSTWLDRYDESGRVLRLHPFSLWDLVERHLRTPFSHETPPPNPPAIHAENIYIRCQYRPDCDDARAAAVTSTSTYDNEEDELQKKLHARHNNAEDTNVGDSGAKDEPVKVNLPPLWHAFIRGHVR